MSERYSDRYSRSPREEKGRDRKGRQGKAQGRFLVVAFASCRRLSDARDRDGMDAATRWRFA